VLSRMPSEANMPEIGGGRTYARVFALVVGTVVRLHFLIAFILLALSPLHSWQVALPAIGIGLVGGSILAALSHNAVKFTATPAGLIVDEGRGRTRSFAWEQVQAIPAWEVFNYTMIHVYVSTDGENALFTVSQRDGDVPCDRRADKFVPFASRCAFEKSGRAPSAALVAWPQTSLGRATLRSVAIDMSVIGIVPSFFAYHPYNPPLIAVIYGAVVALLAHRYFVWTRTQYTWNGTGWTCRSKGKEKSLARAPLPLRLWLEG